MHILSLILVIENIFSSCQITNNICSRKYFYKVCNKIIPTYYAKNIYVGTMNRV